MCYDIMGLPHKNIMINIFDMITDTTYDYETCYNKMKSLMIASRYSLLFIIRELTFMAIKNKIIDLCRIVIKLSNLENLVTKSANNDLCVAFLLLVFKKKLNN